MVARIAVVVPLLITAAFGGFLLAGLPDGPAALADEYIPWWRPQPAPAPVRYVNREPEEETMGDTGRTEDHENGAAAESGREQLRGRETQGGDTGAGETPAPAATPGAVTAAELVAGQKPGLTRYRNAGDVLTEAGGTLEDVYTFGERVWIVMRPVDGIKEHQFVGAAIHEPTAEIDAVLQEIGPGGRITLVGMANANRTLITEVRMETVLSVNGVPTGETR